MKFSLDEGLRIASGGCTIILMFYRHTPACFFFIAVAVTLITPVSPVAWELEEAGFASAPYPLGAVRINSPNLADMNFDGTPESLLLDDNHLSILSGKTIVWQSEASWMVTRVSFGDLNMDNIPEATILAWRPFKPWPVDEFLPHGGRIDTFQDGSGFSCHLILIGWIRDGYGEIWAGSALADPITTFSIADVTGNSTEELITLEGRYARKGSTFPIGVKVWQWNGFGFTVVSSMGGTFSDLVLVRGEQGRIMILTP